MQTGLENKVIQELFGITCSSSGKDTSAEETEEHESEWSM